MTPDDEERMKIILGSNDGTIHFRGQGITKKIIILIVTIIVAGILIYITNRLID